MAARKELDCSSMKPFSFDRSLSLHGSCESNQKPQQLSRFTSLKKSEVSSDSIVGKVRRLCSSFESAASSGAQSPLQSIPAAKPLLRQLSSGIDAYASSASTFKRALSSLQLGFDRSRLMKSIGFGDGGCSTGFNDRIVLPGTEDRIVVYFTSLRGIRRTYEDCCAVRMILRGFRVSVDERDISMDSAYRKELQSVLCEKTVSLPQMFIRGKHIGGAEEVKQLHETGELAKILKGFPVRNQGFSVCEGCGDARFVPCVNCNGSRKVFCEEDERLRRCPDCNENGLIRCPECCY